MTFLSTFAGIGGFDLALERVGMRCVGQVEIDPACRGVLARHFPEVDRHPDIRTTTRWWHAQPRPHLDLLVGGFPCQDLSSANTRTRTGLAGDRSGLFFDLADTIGALRPRWVLLENVPGLLHSNHGRDFTTVLQTLGALGYGVAWRVLDAADHGLPQRRRRVFVVGCRGAVCPLEVLGEPDPGPPDPAPRRPPQDPPPPASADRGAPAAGPAAPPGHHDGDDHDSATVIGPAGRQPVVWVVQGGGWSPLGWREDGPVYTLDTHSRPLLAFTPPGYQQLVVRQLTPRECERVQGFPDGWTAASADGRMLADGVRYRMLGNAVAVPVVEHIGRRLLDIARPDRTGPPP